MDFEKNPSPLLSVLSFNLVKVQLPFSLNSSEIPNLLYIASLEAFNFYSNFGFQTGINSQAITIFYLFFHGSTAIWK